MSLSIRSSKMAAGAPVRERVAMGDPGLFSFLGGAIKGAIGGLIRGGPLGVIGGAIRGALGGRGGAPIPPPLITRAPVGTQINRAALISRFQQTVPVQDVPGVRGAIERFLPGGRTGREVAIPANGARCPSGFHLNKTGYFVASSPGNPSAGGSWVAPETMCVRNRRRNPLNPRAADRAIGRLTSAKRAVQRLNRITIRKKKCP